MECKKPDIGLHLKYRPFVQPMDKPTFSRFPHRRPLESSKHVTHCRPSSSLYIPISASFLGPDLQSYQFCKGYWTWMTPINSQRPMHSWYRTRNQHSYFWINSLSYKQNYWNKNKQKKSLHLKEDISSSTFDRRGQTEAKMQYQLTVRLSRAGLAHFHSEA